MRWSLVIFTCLLLQSTLSLFSFGLALPTSDESLVPRARTAKYSSAKYRKIAEQHKTDYHVQGNKLVTKPAPAVRSAKALRAMRKKDADHILEHQVLHKALKDQGKQFSDLSAHTQSKVKEAFNSHHNLAYIDKSINRSKAAVYKAGLKGNKAKGSRLRDLYIKKTYQHAQGTAKKIDKILKADGHQGNVHQTLRLAAKKAGIKHR